MDEHLIIDVGMMPTPGNAVLFAKVVRNEDNRVERIGITDSYVDDLINAGDSSLKNHPLYTTQVRI